jgi:hypothetical protein
MNDFSREILILGKKMLAELRGLSSTLLGVQKQIETVAKEQHTKSERERTPPVFRAELQIPEATKSDHEREKSKKIRREWALIGVNVLTLFCVGAYAIINYHMLNEMRTANKDASDSFAQTLGQMKAQTSAQQTAADTGANQLELAERPWLSIDNKSLFITNPLTFNSNGASMHIRYAWKNTGHSPAMHINSKNKLIILSMTKLPQAEAAERQAALCDPLRKIPRWRILEITVFPDDTFPFNEGLGLDESEIAAGLKSRDSSPAPHEGYISIALVGCVDYQFSFVPEHHQTRYAFWIGTPGPGLLWKSDIKPEGVPPNIKLQYMSQSAD